MCKRSDQWVSIAKFGSSNSMALASGLFARPYVARDSGALGHFCFCSTRVVGAVDDAIRSGTQSRRVAMSKLFHVAASSCEARAGYKRAFAAQLAINVGAPA
jgi:hypothetical protein